MKCTKKIRKYTNTYIICKKRKFISVSVKFHVVFERYFGSVTYVFEMFCNTVYIN